MIIVGFKNKLKTLGFVDRFECPKCLNHVNWELLILHKYYTLYYIPIIPSGKEYSLICEGCNYQEIVNKKNFKNYKIKSDIELAFSENEIRENERNLKIDEINRIIEQGKKDSQNISSNEKKECFDLASKKSDEELLTIYFKERYQYIPPMINAVKNEIKKRKLIKEEEL